MPTKKSKDSRVAASTTPNKTKHAKAVAHLPKGSSVPRSATKKTAESTLMRTPSRRTSRAQESETDTETNETDSERFSVHTVSDVGEENSDQEYEIAMKRARTEAERMAVHHKRVLSPKIPREERGSKWTVPSLIPAYNMFIRLFSRPWEDVQYCHLLHGLGGSNFFSAHPHLAAEWSGLTANRDYRDAFKKLTILHPYLPENVRNEVLSDGLVRMVLQKTIALFLHVETQTRTPRAWSLICNPDVNQVRMLTKEALGETVTSPQPVVHTHSVPYPPNSSGGSSGTGRWNKGRGERGKAESYPRGQHNGNTNSEARPAKSNIKNLILSGMAKYNVDERCWACLLPGHRHQQCPKRHPLFRADDQQWLVCRAATGEVPLPSQTEGK